MDWNKQQHVLSDTSPPPASVLALRMQGLLSKQYNMSIWKYWPTSQLEIIERPMVKLTRCHFSCVQATCQCASWHLPPSWTLSWPTPTSTTTEGHSTLSHTHTHTHYCIVLTRNCPNNRIEPLNDSSHITTGPNIAYNTDIIFVINFIHLNGVEGMSSSMDVKDVAE